MKKIIFSLLVASLLSACGGGNEATYDKNIASLQATPPLPVETRPNPDQLGEQYKQAQQNIPVVSPEVTPAVTTPVMPAAVSNVTPGSEQTNSLQNNTTIPSDQKTATPVEIKEVNPVENSNVQ